MDTLLRHQWATLRSWLDEVEVERHEGAPSGLPAWTVRELVVHLGFGIVMLDEVTPAPDDAEPMPLGAYIARYRPAAPAIASATSELAATSSAALASIDEAAARAWAALDRGLPPVVMGRRGPLTSEDFVLTRLLELVVHGDDLCRAVPGDRPSPVLDEAAARVAQTLAGAYELRAERSPDPTEAMPWIRLATGREPSADPNLPLL